jgi:hypothetical protein
VDAVTLAKSLRLRLYVLCSECARIIDLAEDNRPQRDVEGADVVRHAAEEHADWLEVLGINDRETEVSLWRPHPSVRIAVIRWRKLMTVALGTARVATEASRSGWGARNRA